jgi:hypothetical protein
MGSESLQPSLEENDMVEPEIVALYTGGKKEGTYGG